MAIIAHLLPILLTLGILSTSCSTGSPPSAPKRTLILLTSFEPFGKWKVNLTNDVAAELSRLHEKIGADVQIEICRLPVEYDVAAQRALKCLAALPRKPDLALTLGEGRCAIHLETAATNIDQTPRFADNAGIIRTGSAIIPQADRRVPFTLPLDQMFCALRDNQKSRIALSISAGNYVCNNTAFHLAQHFKKLDVPYGLIHIPHSGCAQELRDTGTNADHIAQLLAVALHAHAAKKGSPENRIPATEAQVVQMIASETPSGIEKNCRREFLGQLYLKYQEAKISR